MISHANKYIFVHIPKCGGTSVEKSLLMAENVDLNLDAGGVFKLERLSEEARREYKLSIAGKQHSFLSKYRAPFQKDYFCFTFVRNPWDLLVSKYFYFRRRYTRVSFKEMITRMDDSKMWPRHRLSINQSDFINSNMDYVGRFENLESDFKKICTTLNLNPPKLEHLNTTNHKPYWEYYDEETRGIVARRYEKDIETFGYKFKDKATKTLNWPIKKYTSDNLVSKRIWIYWAQGWDEAPEICKLCKDSWIKLNPTWEVVSLDRDSLRQFIPDDTYSKILKFATHTTQSDVIRLYLVSRYGGLWTDATNICNHPLDDWLVESRLVDNIWLHWDFNSDAATYNFLYSRTPKNKILLKSWGSIIDNSSLHEGGYHRVVRAFSRSLDADLKNKLKTEKQIGRSSNQTSPKQGTKIIANGVKLMLQGADARFIEATRTYPFFKLTWKFKDNDKPLQSVFPPHTKLIYLLRKLSLLPKNE
tara:strand:- start:773 stop:2194 length:1422 start_codon:yes stop_codon:yes gene_type:complete